MAAGRYPCAPPLNRDAGRRVRGRRHGCGEGQRGRQHDIVILGRCDIQPRAETTLRLQGNGPDRPGVEHAAADHGGQVVQRRDTLPAGALRPVRPQGRIEGAEFISDQAHAVRAQAVEHLLPIQVVVADADVGGVGRLVDQPVAPGIAAGGKGHGTAGHTLIQIVVVGRLVAKHDHQFGRAGAVAQRAKGGVGAAAQLGGGLIERAGVRCRWVAAGGCLDVREGGQHRRSRSGERLGQAVWVGAGDAVGDDCAVAQGVAKGTVCARIVLQGQAGKAYVQPVGAQRQHRILRRALDAGQEPGHAGPSLEGKDHIAGSIGRHRQGGLAAYGNRLAGLQRRHHGGRRQLRCGERGARRGCARGQGLDAVCPGRSGQFGKHCAAGQVGGKRNRSGGNAVGAGAGDDALGRAAVGAQQGEGDRNIGRRRRCLACAHACSQVKGRAHRPIAHADVAHRQRLRSTLRPRHAARQPRAQQQPAADEQEDGAARPGGALLPGFNNLHVRRSQYHKR